MVAQLAAIPAMEEAKKEKARLEALASTFGAIGVASINDKLVQTDLATAGFAGGSLLDKFTKTGSGALQGVDASFAEAEFAQNQLNKEAKRNSLIEKVLTKMAGGSSPVPKKGTASQASPTIKKEIENRRLYGGSGQLDTSHGLFSPQGQSIA